MSIVAIPITDVRDITPRRMVSGEPYLDCSVSMNEDQMFEALESFLEHLTDETRALWLEHIKEKKS